MVTTVDFICKASYNKELLCIDLQTSTVPLYVLLVGFAYNVVEVYFFVFLLLEEP